MVKIELTIVYVIPMVTEYAPTQAGIILWMHPANGWVHLQNYSCLGEVNNAFNEALDLVVNMSCL